MSGGVVSGREAVRPGIWNALNDLIADHPMWIGDDGRPLDYSPDRESRIHDFIAEASDALADLLATERQRGREEALREAADSLPALTEGIDRMGTNAWPQVQRDTYSLAIEEAQAAIRALADVPAAADRERGAL